MEKRVFDMTWKDLSRRKCREEGYQFQAGGRAGGQQTWWLCTEGFPGTVLKP